MFTHSAPSDFEPFPVGEPWRLNRRDQAEGMIAKTITATERIPPTDAMASLAARGLAPCLRNAPADAAISKAGMLIAVVPSLDVVVRQLVSGIALIESPGPDYDTSHSEPSWLGWVFVSLPPQGPTAMIRLAESIIHEAMHHNLTAFEGVTPMIASERRFYSPWRHEERAASGVLHGLYVFSCLITYFRHLVAQSDAVASHARNRIYVIESEIATIERSALEEALTPAGLRFCQGLYRLLRSR